MVADPLETGPDYSSGVAGARILVIGGSSFIGINLVAAYRHAGITVVNADIVPPRKSGDRDVWVPADITDLDALREVFSSVRPTHVFHLAARTDLDGRRVADYDANVTGVANLLTVMQGDMSVTRTVVASSRMVCRIGYDPRSDEDYCPSTAYGASKVETERLVRATDGLAWVLVRPTSIWGPWFERPYRDFFLSIDRGRYVHPAGRRIPKSFGFVGNTIWQLHSLMTAPAADVVGRTFYAADDPPLEVGAFADRISHEIGCRTPRRVPLGIMRTIARTGDLVERTGKRAPLTSFRLNNLLTPMVHDLGATMRLSGPLPFDEAAGVAATVAWMRTAGLLTTPLSDAGSPHADGDQRVSLASKGRLRRVRKALVLLRHPVWRRAARSGVAAAVEHRDVPFGPSFATIIDVGAHHGQFSLLARTLYPDAAIICVEPLSEAVAKLRDIHAGDPGVSILPFAAATENASRSMHVSRKTDSSSLLPILQPYVTAFPGTEEARTIDIDARTLDDLLDREISRPVLLKIDAQGGELEVLAGATTVLSQVDAAFVECSFVEFYRGQALADEVIGALLGHGLRLDGAYSVVRDDRGRCLQADLLFRRPPQG